MRLASQPSSAVAREAVARQGRQHQVECVLCGAAVRGRVGQRADGLEQLDDRAGPAVRHDQRQRVVMPRPDVDEVDLDPVDLGRELRKRVQSRLALAPVVLGRPVAGELPQRRQLHALRPILDELLGGPACRRDAPAQVGQFRFRNIHTKRTNRRLGRCLFAAWWCSSGLCHGVLLLSSSDVLVLAD